LRRSLTVRTLVAAFAAVIGLAFAGTASAQRYVVLYRHLAHPHLAHVQVQRAGGDVVAAYGQIGVVVAESSSPDFEAAIERNRQVEGAAPTAAYAAPNGSEGAEGDRHEGGLPNEPAADGDTFSSSQWALSLIHAKEAHALTGGSPKVRVGHIDTGVDAAHPDLAPNVDARRSASCVGGAPNRDPSTWSDDSGHGTHTAGVIAAASNRVGVVGVAPNVKLVVIKASIRQGTRDVFLPEAVICSFMWAARQGVDVANSSYTVDSTLVGGVTAFCPSDPNQSTIIESVERAVRWSKRHGVAAVASAGNSNADITADQCLRLPSELPGVITAAGVGPSGTKSSFSNFGLGAIDVAAPAGEVPPFAAPPASFILSSWPANPLFFTPTTLCDPIQTPCPVPGTAPGTSYYRYMAGTSQAAAHVSGVAALVVSEYGKRRRWDVELRPRRVARILEKTADSVACPADPRCLSEDDANGFYGHGIVNALAAVTLRDNRDRDD
jgi:lantibiotic leader peptide-processing serine protease